MLLTVVNTLNENVGMVENYDASSMSPSITLGIVATAILPTVMLFFKPLSKKEKGILTTSIWVLSFAAYFILNYFGYYAIFIHLIAYVIIAIVVYTMFRFCRKIRNNRRHLVTLDEAIDNEIDIINKNESQKYFTLDGVFAVSSIIITKGNKFLLMKRKDNELWIQPGTYFRSNLIFSISEKDEYKTKISLPYTCLKEGIKRDTALADYNYSYIDIFDSNYTEVKETFSLLTTMEDRRVVEGNLSLNKISPIPFLIQSEKSNRPKSSGKQTHIDMFFPLRLSNDFNLSNHIAGIRREELNCSELKEFSLNEIQNMVQEEGTAYSDLYVICLEFMKLYRKYKFRKNRIRSCTFDEKNNILALRLFEKCNAKCKYCLLGEKHRFIDSLQSIDVEIEKIKECLEKNVQKLSENEYKLILTGGEPLLGDNIFSAIDEVISMDEYKTKIKSISICTNGINWEKHESQIKRFVDRINTEKIDFKFVINFPAYNTSTYKHLVGIQAFEKVVNFIKFLSDEDINFLINVVLSANVKSKLEEYIKFWNKNNIKNIVLSYAIRTQENKNKSLLSKQECIDLYDMIQSGDYEIEHFDNLELIIPNCNDSFCGGKKINSLYHENDEYMLKTKCLDK